MEHLFLIIRLPFFILAAGLFTIYFAGVFVPALLGFGLFVVPLAWLVFVIPFKLLGAAFENDASAFKEYVVATPAAWLAALLQAVDECLRVYRSLYEWLINGAQATRNRRAA